jgi:hypothetical protein
MTSGLLPSLQPVDSLMNSSTSTFRHYLNSARNNSLPEETPPATQRSKPESTSAVKAKLMHFKLATPEQIIKSNTPATATALPSPSSRTMIELRKNLASSPTFVRKEDKVIAQKLETRFSLHQRDTTRQTIGNYLADRAHRIRCVQVNQHSKPKYTELQLHRKFYADRIKQIEGLKRALHEPQQLNPVKNTPFSQLVAPPSQFETFHNRLREEQQ